MSSSYVRTNIKNYFATEFPSDILVDFTAEERDIVDILKQYSIADDDDWYGIQFIGSDEEPISVATDTNQGCYRERGSIFFHVIVPVASGAGDSIVLNADSVRTAFRGARINDIIIESVTPVNTENGSTLQFEYGYTSGSFIMDFYRDINL